VLTRALGFPSITRRFEADYLESDKNPNLQAYVNAMQKLFAKYGDTRIAFADFADKINRGNSVQRRGIVLTNACVYRHDPRKVRKLRSSRFVPPIAKFVCPTVHFG